MDEMGELDAPTLGGRAPGSLLVVGDFSDAEEPLGEAVCRLLYASGWDVPLSRHGDRTDAAARPASLRGGVLQQN